MNSDIEQLASLAHSQLAHQNSQAAQNGNNKRSAHDDSPSNSKSKRSRYISLACNECKRRKIKCNGQTPCERCSRLNLECVYAPNCCSGFKDSQEFKDLTAQIESLQEHVNALYENLSSLRVQLGQTVPLQPPSSFAHQHSQPQSQYQQLPSIDPSLQMQSYNDNVPQHGQQASPSPGRPRSQAQQHSTFRGITSSNFNFEVAKSSLQTMGISAKDGEDPDETAEGNGDEAEANIRRLHDHLLGPGQLHDSIHVNKDPIWVVTKEEALRLCDVYEDETRMMYPVLDVDNVKAYIVKLFPFLGAMRTSGLMQQGMPGADAVEDEDTNVLKMVLAIALTVEEGGRSQLGKRFFDSVQPIVDNLLLGDVSINGIRLLVMTAVYEFQRDNESTSWRLIGLAARLCIELGLHKHETYDAIKSESQRSETILLFWACYVLDRRWSLGTGMPFALQEDDIDPDLPKPGDKSPYLMAMIKYGEIGSKIWRSLSAPPSADNGGISPINVEEMLYLDYQVLTWHHSLPQTLQYDRNDNREQIAQSHAERASLRSKVAIYMRANQMRILIHRPILHSATTITQHRSLAQTVVDIAKDTIRVLTELNRTSDLYRTQQVVFHAFLTSALAVLFLAISHTPAFFASEVREEFYMALDLVRGLSKGSFVSKRLWRTIKTLKEIGPKLGLDEGKPDAPSVSQSLEVPPAQSKKVIDPNRSAAVAMAGLAGHNVDETALYNNGDTPQTWISESDTSGNPEKMASDLVKMFEAASNLPDSGQQQERQSEQSVGLHPIDHQTPSAGWMDDELSNVLKELF